MLRTSGCTRTGGLGRRRCGAQGVVVRWVGLERAYPLSSGLPNTRGEAISSTGFGVLEHSSECFTSSGLAWGCSCRNLGLTTTHTQGGWCARVHISARARVEAEKVNVLVHVWATVAPLHAVTPFTTTRGCVVHVYGVRVEGVGGGVSAALHERERVVSECADGVRATLTPAPHPPCYKPRHSGRCTGVPIQDPRTPQQGWGWEVPAYRAENVCVVGGGGGGRRQGEGESSQRAQAQTPAAPPPPSPAPITLQTIAVQNPGVRVGCCRGQERGGSDYDPYWVSVVDPE
jgi:hypothetical protein